VREVHCINFVNRGRRGKTTGSNHLSARWVFDFTTVRTASKRSTLTLQEGESADLLFVAPWSLTPATEVL
jgi:hypothetical protein